jgi:hypothetical protein
MMTSSGSSSLFSPVHCECLVEEQPRDEKFFQLGELLLSLRLYYAAASASDSLLLQPLFSAYFDFHLAALPFGVQSVFPVSVPDTLRSSAVL